MSDPGRWEMGGTWALGSTGMQLGYGESRGGYCGIGKERLCLGTQALQGPGQDSRQTGAAGGRLWKAWKWGLSWTSRCPRDLSSRVA